MQFCQHHRSSHFCVFNNRLCHPDAVSTLTDSDQSPDGLSVFETLQRPLARVLNRVEAFNRVKGRYNSNLRAAPCQVLVSRLLSSQRATDHHRFYQHCHDCADFASSLSKALHCLIHLGNIQQRLQKTNQSPENQAEDDQEVRHRLHYCFVLLTSILVLLLLLILILSLKLFNFI